MVFSIGQMAESVILQPKLLGDKIGLHPVAVIFAVLAGGNLFGLTGVLLALPVAAVILVLLKEVKIRYQHSDLYNDQNSDKQTTIIEVGSTYRDELGQDEHSRRDLGESS